MRWGVLCSQSHPLPPAPSGGPFSKVTRVGTLDLFSDYPLSSDNCLQPSRRHPDLILTGRAQVSEILVSHSAQLHPAAPVRPCVCAYRVPWLTEQLSRKKKHRPFSKTITSTPTTAVKMASLELTYQDVAEHNTKKDLYMVIHDVIYDVGKFVDEHP